MRIPFYLTSFNSPIVDLYVILACLTVYVFLVEVVAVFGVWQVIPQQLVHLEIPQEGCIAEDCPLLRVGVKQEVSEIAHELEESDFTIADSPEDSPGGGAYQSIFVLENFCLEYVTV